MKFFMLITLFTVLSPKSYAECGEQPNPWVCCPYDSCNKEDKVIEVSLIQTVPFGWACQTPPSPIDVNISLKRRSYSRCQSLGYSRSLAYEKIIFENLGTEISSEPGCSINLKYRFTQSFSCK